LKRFKPGEMLTTVVLSLNVFVLLTCYYLLKVVREPLILLGGGGAELKAYASAGQTLLLLAVVPAFGMLASRTTRVRLLTIVQLIFIGCLVGFYVLAQANAPVGIAFYLWLGIFNVMVVSNFWSFANDVYTEEQGKRLFPIIGIGASVGAILGAFLPRLLHELFGTYPLMLVAAAGLGVSIVMYRFVDHVQRTVPASPAAVEAPVGRAGGFALVMKDRYLRLLAAMLLVATIINTTGEYVVGKMASEQSKVYAEHQLSAAHAAPTPAADAVIDDKVIVERAREEYISSFYSSYYTLVNLIALLLQAFIVARLLEKLGIRRTLFVMPVIVVVGWLGTAIFATVTMARAEKTAENSLDYSLHNTVRQVLFLPTSRESKYKAKAAIDTFFFRMGDVIAGVGLVVLFVEVLGLGIRAFAVLNVCLGLLWLVMAARAGALHAELIAAQTKRALAGGEGAAS
jgi:AAA family ATP:ADP antiporter